MAEVDYSQLSDEDLMALSQNNYGNLSDEALLILSGKQAPPAPVFPANSPEDLINQAVNIEGPVEMAPSEAEQFMEQREATPAEDLLAGANREIEQVGRGIKQMYYSATGNEAEAKALQLVEQRAREEYGKVDEGLGFEDAGEMIFSLGSLLIPGGAPVQVATKGSKALQALTKLKNAAGTAGADAVLYGLLEATKATVEGESRLEKGATTAAVSAGSAWGLDKLTKGTKSLFQEGFIGKALAAVGLHQIPGAASTVRQGTTSRVLGVLWPRRRGPGPEELARIQAAKVPISPQSQSMRGAAMKQELKDLESTAGAAKAWEIFEDTVKGAKNPKTGKRSGGFVGARANKWAKENNFDSKAEAGRIASWLTERSLMKGPKGEMLFDRVEFVRAWETLSQQEAFRRAFGNVSSTGNWTPNKATKEVARLVEEIKSNSGRLSPREVLDYYDKLQRQAASETTTGIKAPSAAVEKQLAAVKDRATALLAGEASTQEEGLTLDVLTQAMEEMTNIWAGSD